MNLGTFGFGAKSEPINGIIGSGSVPKIPKFTAANAIGDSQISDNGTTVFIGVSATSAKAAFEVNSTTKGVFLPRVTTAQQTAIGAGATDTSLLMFNTTNNRYEFYNHSDTSYKRLLIPEDVDNITVGTITTPASHTGNTNITLLGYISIPANTYQNGDIFDVYCLTGKGTVNSDTTRLYLNTSNTLNGSEKLIALRTSSSWFKGFSRYFGVRTGSMIGTPTPTNTALDSSMVSGNLSTANRIIAIDWTVQQYLLITTQLTDITDVNILDFAYLKRHRP